VELINAIIQDLKSCGSKRKLNSKGAPQTAYPTPFPPHPFADAAQALLAVKTLGKDPAGSKYLAKAPNLLTLLGFATTFKDDPDASSEALRSIANALLLIEEARSTFISKEVNGGDTCILMLEVFLSSRTIWP